MQIGLNIDTLSAVEGLIASGMPQGQAKAMVEMLKNVEVSGEVKKSEFDDIKIRLERVEKKVDGIETKLGDVRVEIAHLTIKIPGIIIGAAALYRLLEKFI